MGVSLLLPKGLPAPCQLPPASLGPVQMTCHVAVDSDPHLGLTAPWVPNLPAVPSPASRHLGRGSRVALLTLNSVLRRYLPTSRDGCGLTLEQGTAGALGALGTPPGPVPTQPAALPTSTPVHRLPGAWVPHPWPGPCSPAGRCPGSGPPLWPPGREGSVTWAAPPQSRWVPRSPGTFPGGLRCHCWSQEKSVITLGAAEDHVLVPPVPLLVG